MNRIEGESGREIFLDCDGVLADFDSYAEKIFGLPPRKAEEKLGAKRFWCDLQSHDGFYRNLPLMPDARELFDAVAHLNPIILTGLPLGDWAEPQKREWGAKHFPGTTMICCMSADKRNHMKPGDVLIDDFLKYKSLWVEAGGVFIHHTSARASLAELRKLGIVGESGLGDEQELRDSISREFECGYAQLSPTQKVLVDRRVEQLRAVASQGGEEEPTERTTTEGIHKVHDIHEDRIAKIAGLIEEIKVLKSKLAESVAPSSLPTQEKLDLSKVTYFVHKKDGGMESSDDPYRRDYVSYQDFTVLVEHLRDRDEHIKYAYAALGPDANRGIYLFDHIAKLKAASRADVPVAPLSGKKIDKDFLANELAIAAMSIFIPESNMDSDDPGGRHSFNQAKRRFKEILDGK